MARKSKFFRDAHGIQFQDCPTCGGAGKIVHEANTGYGIDHENETADECFECLGAGVVRVTPVDILESLGEARRLFRGRGMAYQDLRHKALRPAWGLQHAEFMAKVDRVAECVREMRLQVAA